MFTLKLNSSNAAKPEYIADVKKWQKAIGLQSTGIFDQATHNATIKWQNQHKLVPDGKVGTASWGSVGVETGASVKVSPANSDADRWALQVANASTLPMTEQEKQYVLAVARGEGHYGLGWKEAGKGSNNWGAVQGKGSAGSFQHLDYHADGSPYYTNFKAYKTPQEGFSDMARIILGGGPIRKAVGAAELKDAIARGNIRDAVFAQHANKYFELKPEKYFNAVSMNYDALSQSTQWERLLSATGDFLGEALVEHEEGVISGIKVVAGLIIAGAIAFFGYEKYKERRLS